jgi:hypothetical protein
MEEAGHMLQIRRSQKDQFRHSSEKGFRMIRKRPRSALLEQRGEENKMPEDAVHFMYVFRNFYQCMCVPTQLSS